jgi:transcriptional regulator GlxA family with amidase domain
LHRVAVLAFPGVELLDVTGPLEAFASAHALLAEQRIAGGYAVEIAGRAPGSIAASSGLGVTATIDWQQAAEADTVLIAGGRGILAILEDPALLTALRRAAERGRRVGAVCTGAFGLAAAGLLDGRRAVTHWNWCDRLAARFPAVRVERDPIFILDAGIWTSAGVTAGIDMALAMIERDHGPQLSIRTAQELVMFHRRPGGQSQFSAELTVQATVGHPIRRLQEWVLENLAADLSVEALAARAAMSPRNFARVFRLETGGTPARFVEQARLQKARTLLEKTSMNVAAIAQLCGYGSADVLTRAMQRRVRTLPGDYRKRFGAIWRPQEITEAMHVDD